MKTLEQIRQLRDPLKNYQFTVCIDNNLPLSFLVSSINIEHKKKTIVMEILETHDLTVWSFLNSSINHDIRLKIELLDNQENVLDYITPTVEILRAEQVMDKMSSEAVYYKLLMRIL